MEKSAWSPIASYVNEKPFTILFSSELHNDSEFPGLPIVAVPSEHVARVVADGKIVKSLYDYAVGVDGFDSACWSELKYLLPNNEDELVLIKMPDGGDEAGNLLLASNAHYVISGNAVNEMHADKWTRIPYPLPA